MSLRYSSARTSYPLLPALAPGDGTLAACPVRFSARAGEILDAPRTSTGSLSIRKKRGEEGTRGATLGRAGHMISLESLEQQLRARGCKLTRQRRAVLRVVTATEGRLDAATVCEDAKAECPEIGLTTVYRTLDILADMGALRRLHLPDGCSTYAPASPGHRHHVICVECGRAVEFEGCDLTALLDSVASKTGFKVEDHWLQLLGRCPACQGKPCQGKR